MKRFVCMMAALGFGLLLLVVSVLVETRGKVAFMAAVAQSFEATR